MNKNHFVHACVVMHNVFPLSQCVIEIHIIPCLVLSFAFFLDIYLLKIDSDAK